MRAALPLLLFFVSFAARADWMRQDENLLQNSLSVRLALAANNVDPSTTSALVARSGPGPMVKRYHRIKGREEIISTEATTVALLELDEEAAADSQQTWRVEAGEICASIEPGGFETAGGQLNAISPYGQAMVEGDPMAQLFLGQNEGQLITWLKPGEQVTMVQAVSRKRGRRAQRIELNQHDRQLTITQQDKGAEACYGRR